MLSVSAARVEFFGQNTGGAPTLNFSSEYTELLNAHQAYHHLEFVHWQQQVFSPQWWLLLGLFFVPWLVWWRLADKSRMPIILSYGLIIMLFVIGMDALGIAFHCWMYPIKLLPVIPHEVTIDWSMLPVYHMLIFQYFPRWRSFIIVELIGSALLAFVGEPIAERIGIYYVLNWQHIWSFPIYFLKAVIGKGIIDYLVSRGRSSVR